MAVWPLAPLTFYVVGTVVPPGDLNSIQSAINGLYGATQTVKGLQTDPSGGNPANPGAGNILASGNIQSQTPTSRALWIGPAGPVAVAGGWIFSATNPPRWQAAANGNQLIIPIPLILQSPYVGGTSIVQAITSVSARIFPWSTGVVTLQLFTESNLSTTSNILATQVGSTASSNGTSNHQTITVTPAAGTLYPTNDQLCYAQLTAAQANDTFYGLYVVYTTVVF